MGLDKKLLSYSDEELIKEFQDNNTIVAYEILVKRFKDPLTNFVYRFLGNRDATIDVVQDTMIKFYLKKDSYKSIAKFSTWIYTIAGNLAKNELKRRNRRHILSISNNDPDDFTLQIEDKKFVAPDRAADSNIKGDMVQRALLKVKPIYRELVILRDIEGFSYDEIAEMTELSIGTVKSRINRGRAHLQKLLKNIY